MPLIFSLIGRRKIRVKMRIACLADHQDVIPVLAAWFHQEWAYLYPGRTVQDVSRSISERINRDKIPLALLAFEDDELVGTVCLKSADMDTRPELTPWLAGLYVKESRRGKGIGTALVRAIEAKALAMGINRLFLYTPAAEHFYADLGWRLKERTCYHNVPVSLMEKLPGN